MRRPPPAAAATTAASSSASRFNALIKTHHVTSRKKIAILKKASRHNATSYALVRSGGCPGLMYVEGDERGVKGWIDAVQVTNAAS